MLDPFMRPFWAALVAAVLIDIPTPAKAESWTDLRGTRTVEARMVGMWGDSVVLQMQNGSRVSVNVNALRSESRIQAQRLQREMQAARGQRIKELQGQAVAAAAPAPDPLPMPPAAPAYKAPQAGQPVIDFLNQLDVSIRDGHLIAMYDALPPAYRADVNEVVKLAADKMDQTNWQATVGTLHQLGDLIVTHQRWFLSSPRIKNLPPEQFDIAAEELLTIAGALRSGLSSDVVTLEKLRSTPLDKWLVEFDRMTAPHVAQLFRQANAAASRDLTLDSQKDETANVTVDRSGVKSRVAYQNVEGYWVPKSLADSWTDTIASWKQKIADAPEGTLMSPVTVVTGGLSPMTASMASAGTADQFHGAMESIVSSAEMFASGLGALFGKSFSLAGNSRRGSGGYDDYDGYDSSMDDYEAQMEAEMAAQMEAQTRNSQ